ncbi:mfs general substrate transporter [Diplodia corticola]|uniref:Mfs general substrate transporter n=1 Tax=Diplodia corticola TaxID=236234 RepID=A0A1J9RR48_9PEZI|nr:mfs general substrate transporter [Diplodia corticola]OJD30013.1 mfs general substrate transporter [Diplodia corticola]
MPPTTTSTAPVVAPTSTGFDGDDFSNNLFSDLAPLLTLFGEQVTKQFFSLSFGWADHILLAMGPIGIITIIVSAIRVSGPKRLKAIVGRARESLATAEAELLSSTSQNVCEMWDGNQVVRAIGKPQGMQHLVVLKDKIGNNDRGIDPELRILDFQSAFGLGIFSPPRLAYQRQIFEEQPPPNITLNTADSTLSDTELWFWAIVGTILQVTALVVPALVVYLWKWQEAGETIAALLAAISSFVTIAGYIVQFVGLRSLHWSATIIQLGVTLAMTCFRAWVRRGLTAQPICLSLEISHAIAKLAFFLMDDFHEIHELADQILPNIHGWNLYTAHDSDCPDNAPAWNPTSLPIATLEPYKVNETVLLHQYLSVEGIMEYLSSSESNISLNQNGASEKGYLAWTVSTTHKRMNSNHPDGPTKFADLTTGVARTAPSGMYGQLRWKVNLDEIRSIIDLWEATLREKDGQYLVPTGVFSEVHTSRNMLIHWPILSTLDFKTDNTHPNMDWLDGSGFWLVKKVTTLTPDYGPGIHCRPDMGAYYVFKAPPDSLANRPNEHFTHFLVYRNLREVREACALELLGLFLSTISSETEQIGGATQIESNRRTKPRTSYDEPRNKHTEPLWTNTAIDELCSCIEKAELVKTVEEARRFVIPALSRYNLLPKESSEAQETPIREERNSDPGSDSHTQASPASNAEETPTHRSRAQSWAGTPSQRHLRTSDDMSSLF